MMHLLWSLSVQHLANSAGPTDCPSLCLQNSGSPTGTDLRTSVLMLETSNWMLKSKIVIDCHEDANYDRYQQKLS